MLARDRIAITITTDPTYSLDSANVRLHGFLGPHESAVQQMLQG